MMLAIAVWRMGVAAPRYISAKLAETASAPRSDRLVFAAGLNCKIIDLRQPQLLKPKGWGPV